MTHQFNLVGALSVAEGWALEACRRTRPVGMAHDLVVAGSSLVQMQNASGWQSPEMPALRAAKPPRKAARRCFRTGDARGAGETYSGG